MQPPLNYIPSRSSRLRVRSPNPMAVGNLTKKGHTCHYTHKRGLMDKRDGPISWSLSWA